ncbi:5-(carboxyamino)imidazole ribonucleotide synthase [Micrococcus lylae]|uniref:5-(carboxyamino)imidazole ribonucleotide synthase n=1 Tax=Micrococcus lylae TaxID=1273 RepID=UPI003EC11EE2
MTSPTSPRLGVIGGGQLARMMAGPAAELGVRFSVLAEAPDASAAQVAPHTVGDHTDLEALRAFARTVDVITFDHEHVPTEHLRALEEEGVAVRPGPDALQYAQDKLAMRAAIEELGLPNPAWAPVSDVDEILAFGAEHGWPMILKTPRGGYDGKGVLRLDSAEDVRSSAADGTLGTWLGAGIAPLLAEEFVPFTRELSAQVARTPSGELKSYPVVDSVQTNGVCDLVTAPAQDLSDELADAAASAARAIAERLGVTGMLAVEMFQTGEGADGFQVNELAMRPHNSGHWSMDGAVTGQFEQHARAVLDLPLGDVSLHGEAVVMKNLLGGANEDLYAEVPHALGSFPEAKVHLYGKGVRPGRKLGHVNVVVRTAADLPHAVEAAEAAVARIRDGGTPGAGTPSVPSTVAAQEA